MSKRGDLDEAFAESDALYEAADHGEVPEHVFATRPNRARTTTLSVRVNDDEYASLRRYAERRDVPMSTAVRGFILAGMRSHGLAAGADAEPARLDDLESRVKDLEHAVYRD